MKKLLLLLAFSAVVCVLHAQNGFVVPYKLYKVPEKKLGFRADSSYYNGILKKLGRPHIQQYPGDTTLIAGVEPIQLIFLGNNGRGLDVYKATLDNMPVVKPDSTFYSGMPTGNNKYQMLQTPLHKK